MSGAGRRGLRGDGRQPKDDAARTVPSGRRRLASPSRVVGGVLAVCLVLGLGYWLFTAQIGVAELRPRLSAGQVDLSGLDLAREVGVLPTGWDYWPGQLLSPADLAAGRGGPPRRFTPADERTQAIGTYRLEVRLPADGSVYGLSGWSLDYATRLFVDGRALFEVGQVADAATEAAPRIQHYTVAFEPKAARGPGPPTVELVIQYANFVHPEGGMLRELEIGALETVLREVDAERLTVWMLSGAMVMLMVFYLVRFVVVGRAENLAFAACCLVLAVRNQYIWMQLLPPDYDWVLSYRINYVCLSAIYVAFGALVRYIYPSRLVRIVFRCVMGIQLAAYLVVALVDVGTVIWLGRVTAVFYTALSVAMLGLFAARLRRPDLKDRLAAVGGIAFVATGFAEAALINHLPLVTRNGIAAAGMMVFAICYMIVLNLGAERAAVELDREVERVGFYRQLSHDLRTPLTRLSTNIQVAGLAGEVDRERLRQSQDEVMRMASMLDSALEVGGRAARTASSNGQARAGGPAPEPA
ncbi:MAG: hypothetical protein LBO20_05505, partial [Bifidobacteriaceae bacterium]|nr:hypothetical protein [Bifidobacteriaceae bacterium]